MQQGPDWEDSVKVAKSILHDRRARRKWTAGFLLLEMLAVAVGLWLIDGWLAESPMCFLLWWAGVAIGACVVMIFALYDALAVIREERNK